VGLQDPETHLAFVRRDVRLDRAAIAAAQAARRVKFSRGFRAPPGDPAWVQGTLYTTMLSGHFTSGRGISGYMELHVRGRLPPPRGCNSATHVASRSSPVDSRSAGQ
jgi:hypothetical protein